MSFFRIILIVFVLSVLVNCGGSGSKESEDKQALIESIDSITGVDPLKTDSEYYIIFGEVQDRAVVYINGVQVFDTQTTKKNKSIFFGLDEVLRIGRNQVKVEIYNDQNIIGRDTSWKVYYELFRYEEPIDFVNEGTSTGDIGIVYERTHIIDWEG